MALIVKFSPSGPNLDQLGYYDPLTGVSLTRSAPTSSDLSAFSTAQLTNISQAVASSILVLVSGSLPTATITGPATTVAVSTLPALPTGANTIGAVTQSGTWNIGSITTLPALPTGSNTIGAVGLNAGIQTIGSVGVQVSGAAVSTTNPIPMYDAYLAPTAVAWASGTALNTALTVNTAGYDTVVVTAVLSGTITGGALTWELYDGVNWLGVKAPRTDSYQTDSTFTMSGAPGNHAWQIPVAGFPQFRVRLSTALSGTSPGVSLTIITSSAPDTSIVTVGLDPSQALPAGTNLLGSVGVQVAGAAVSVTNPIPIYDAYLAPAAVAWSSGTAVNTAATSTVNGYDTVIVTVVPSGTITGGTLTWEVYDGVTWLGVKAPRTDSYLTDLTFSCASATSHAWQIPVAGFSQFRVRLSTALTGTGPQVTVTTIVSSAPDTSIVTVGLDPTQALPAGTNIIGSIATRSGIVGTTVTCTSGSAYTAGQVVGGLLSWASIFGTAQTGVLESIVLTCKSNQTAGFKLYLFTANPTSSTWTDKSSPAINSADISKVIGPFYLSGYDSGLGTGTFYTISGIGQSLTSATAGLYGVLVTTGTPTFTTTTDLYLTVGVLQD